MPDRLGACDVHYPPGGGATAALVISNDPRFATITYSRATTLEHVADYVPGRFYERELPALEAVLDGEVLDTLIVDGYVDLDSSGRPGLGLTPGGPDWHRW